MIELDKINAPLWGRLLINLLGAVFAYILTFVLTLAFAPPGAFVYFIFLSTLALALLFPHLPYKQSHKWISVTCLLLVVWVAILLVATPIFTKQYYLTQSSKIVPAYSAAKLVEATYSYGGFDVGMSVKYRYQTKTPNEDYKKMHDLYITQLGQYGYDVEEEKDDSVRFKKHNDSTPTVWLGISQLPDTIEVDIDPQSSSCVFILFNGDIKTFIQCQKGWAN